MKLTQDISSSDFEIRPRFQLNTNVKSEDVIKHIVDFSRKNNSMHLKNLTGHIIITIPKEQQHYWTPVLHITIEDNENTSYSTLIRCMVGPNNAVWALFILMYAAIGILTMFGGMYGIIQWHMNLPAPWLWCFPSAIVLSLTLFFSAKIGQKKGHYQMIYLIRFFMDSIKGIDYKPV